MWIIPFPFTIRDTVRAVLNSILELDAWGRGAGVEGLVLEGSSCTGNARIMLLADVISGDSISDGMYFF